jgi:hypothetical protein
MLHHSQFLKEKLFMFLNKQSILPLLHQYQFLLLHQTTAHWRRN